MVQADPQMLAAAETVVSSLNLPRGSSEFGIYNPADGRLLATLPDLTPQEALDAVGQADEAGRRWACRTARERADALHAWYELITHSAEQIALLITLEMGKPLKESRAEVSYASDFVRWYAEEALRPAGSFRDAPDGAATLMVRRAPIGLAVLITPWNFPLAMATRKIAPALAAGCPVVIKPSELTPLTTFMAVGLARQAGVPAELIQVISTTDAAGFSEALLTDSRVRKISFTGSTRVGKILLRLASEQVLRPSMELGGNAPLIVFDDADLDRAIEGTYAAKMRNGGQSCIAANRIYVQDGIAEAFVEGLTEKMRDVVMGDGLGPGVGLAPLISHQAVSSVGRLVEDAVQRGASLLTRGEVIDGGEGSYFPATVLDHVPAEAELASTEIFGPVAAIQRFTDEEEVVQRANATEFGLAGYVFTENLDRALNVADSLQTGLVGINQGVPSNAAAPFGGLKQSGLGREGGGEGLEEYQETRFYNVARRETERGN